MLITRNHSRREPKPMVRSRGPGLYHRLLVHGPAYDPRPGLPILGIGAQEIGSFHDLGVHGLFLHHRLPMVLLGLFAGVQPDSYKWLHRQPGCLWAQRRAGNAFPGLATDT